MPLRPLKKLSLGGDPRATKHLEDWLGGLADRLADPKTDRNELCRDTLFEIHYPHLSDYEGLLEDPATSATLKAALLSLDPRHVRLEPEYYAELDPARYAPVKPLLWLWQGFDRSPMGGGNVELGVRIRRILASHVFAQCGENFKCFQFVEFSFGYNMIVGDNVVIHRHVLLDDRGGITLGNRTSVADYANIYSHTHSILDQVDVENRRTVLGEGVRITYHATVLAGVHIGDDAMVGAHAVATKDVPPHAVALGVPARPVRIKER